MPEILRIARKEFTAFFTSPIAYIFLGTFLAVTLFVFFWVETFFARNIADVRPLFEWMPLLLIFLVAAVTMRMWAEERRSGTLEFLLTAPVSPLQLVLGKFLACLGLVAVALALTLPLPITIAVLGDLDWGPVIGGYVASLFLAAAYIAIGLFVSSRSDNQIVSLIVTTVVCGLFYLLGSSALTDLAGTRLTEWLQRLGTGARFASITRGVIDLRDLYYYLSLVITFLALNVFVLEWLRWQGNRRGGQHGRWALLTALVIANALAANVWLARVGWARIDLTEGNLYSISDVTRETLRSLREPLLIRGYFSKQTHPLLAPLVPQLRDLMEEYRVAGGDRVRVEIIDPAEHPDLEREAAEKYDIEPVPFQIASKYQASVVNSYFDILVKYGDQYETLGYEDLIEFKARRASVTELDVELRNPEYDLTRAIRKVVAAYRASGTLFRELERPVTLHAFVSPADNLPPPLDQLRRSLDKVVEDFKARAGDKFQVEIVDPATRDAAFVQELAERYGFRPLTIGLLDPRQVWFHLVLEDGRRTVPVTLPESLSENGLKANIENAVKRFSGGFLKTIALYTPDEPAGGPMGGRGKSFAWLRDRLEQEHDVRSADLKDGRVPAGSDLLFLAAPLNLDEKQRFAVDQFLMQGGTVVLATSAFDVDLMGGLSAHQNPSGLEDWLAHHGITIAKTMVLDPQSSLFPVPVNRRVNGFVIRETRVLNYPYFVEIRDDGINHDTSLTSGLHEVTMSWASPLSIDEEKNAGRTVTPLLYSSPAAWTSDSLAVQPDPNAPDAGFTPKPGEGRKLLGVVIEGAFDSFFKGKPSPLAERKETENETDQKEDDEPVISGVIERSPESARLIVLASNTFLTDTVLQLMSASRGTQYLNPVQLAGNAVDWSLEDRGLLALRGRAHFSRTLEPLDRKAQLFWEYLNYALGALGLFLVWLLHRALRARSLARYRQWLSA
ncbi:MAG: hypothetical protein KatS3mg121_1497 [Gammaproteobacteria bacterium]|nr:MAG: hypothetical protein KatS3mg121_1497 [Gammaproteobacteria bacterium]